MHSLNTLPTVFNYHGLTLGALKLGSSRCTFTDVPAQILAVYWRVELKVLNMYV